MKATAPSSGVAIGCLLSIASAVGGAPPIEGDGARAVKIAPWLRDELALRSLEGGGAARKAEEDPLLALLPARPGEGLAIDARALRAAGAEIVRRTPDLVLARMSLGALDRIARDPAIGFIRPPFVARSLQVEVARILGADSWHAAGRVAAGVRVGLIDTDFSRFSEIFAGIGLRDLHTWAAPGRPFGEPPDGGPMPVPMPAGHGVACAEAIHDLAPGAAFYLAQLGDDTLEADFSAALDWLVAEGVRIVSCSIGLSGEYYDDGRSPLCLAVDRARERGVLFCQAAGNEAIGRFWAGIFTDADGDGFHEFAPGDSGDDIAVGISMGLPMPDMYRITLAWEGGPRTAEDYDLLVYARGRGTPVAESAVRQTGTQPPLEQIVFPPLFWEPPFSPPPWIYEIRIRRIRATRPHGMRLCVEPVGFGGIPRYPQYWSPERSIGTPGDARGAFTVGAIELGDWGLGIVAEYSSRGPTADGRIKPDIVAPAGIRTSATAPLPFSGTSASAPICAGAAALVLERLPGPDAVGQAALLRQWAEDVGPAGADPIFGAGKLRLPPPEALAPPEVEAIEPSAGPPEGGTPCEIRGSHFTADGSVFFGEAPALDVRILDSGRLACLSPPGRGTVDVVVRNTLGEGRLGDGFAYREERALFIRGDVDASGQFTLGDAIYLLNYLFARGTRPPCMDAADLEDDGSITLGDVIYLLNYLFVHGPNPAGPEPGSCAEDSAEPDPWSASACSFPPCR